MRHALVAGIVLGVVFVGCQKDAPPPPRGSAPAPVAKTDLAQFIQDAEASSAQGADEGPKCIDWVEISIGS